jgi:hypothetical protein
MLASENFDHASGGRLKLHRDMNFYSILARGITLLTRM